MFFILFTFLLCVTSATEFIIHRNQIDYALHAERSLSSNEDNNSSNAKTESPNTPTDTFCPFLQLNDSPCSPTSACANDAHSIECKSEVRAWCRGTHGKDDTGCVSLSIISKDGSNNNNNQNQNNNNFCPFSNPLDVASPCHITSKCVAGKSPACEAQVVAWCSQHASLIGNEGCIGIFTKENTNTNDDTATTTPDDDTPTTTCPFSKGTGSPCDTPICKASGGATSVDCQTIVRTWCMHHSQDENEGVLLLLVVYVLQTDKKIQQETVLMQQLFMLL